MVDGARFGRKEPVFGFIIVLLLSIFRALGLRPRVSGAQRLPEEGGYVLAVSHFSYLDFALAGFVVWESSRRPTRYMATKASFDHWLTGPLMKGAKHVPVERGTGPESMAAATAALQSGEIMGMFPEGRVSASWELLPFKTGAVRLAQQAGVPIVPCTIWGSHRVLTRGAKLSLFRAFRAPIVIDIGEPYLVPADQSPAEANEHLRSIMSAMMHAAQDGFPIRSRGKGAWWQPARLGGGAPVPQSDEELAALQLKRRSVSLDI